MALPAPINDERARAAISLRRRRFAALLVLALLIPVATAMAETAPPAVDRTVFPGATRFGSFSGTPPSAPVYRDGDLAGYVLSTQAVVASAGYSGKPLDVFVGLDLDGRITGARLVEHHEPILVIGVRDEDLEAFVRQFRGLDVRAPIKVVERREAGAGEVDSVAGATISSVVISDSILRAARAVARDRGIIGDGGSRLDLDRFGSATWPVLVADGSISARRFTVGDVDAALARHEGRYGARAQVIDPASTFIELFLALATPARVGRNLLGKRLYNRIGAELGETDHMIFVAARGLYSFKGTRYVREGIFDRFQIVQGDRTYQFTRSDHVRIERLALDGAPELREQAIFVLRGGTGFDPAAPWRFDLRVEGRRADGSATSTVLSAGYALPASYVKSKPPPVADQAPLWVRQWQARLPEIAILCGALIVLSAILFFQDAVARRRRLFERVRIAFLVFTLVWLGWYTAAQLSVINVLTFADALMTSFRWDFFLLEPSIFILWSFVAVTLLFWGRGVFCGWLCPFGALQELVNKVGKRLRVPEVELPFGLHERAWPLKYVAFLSLFALSIGGVGWLHVATEIEPFKTAIVLAFDREWPYVIYALALLTAGAFVNRFFCRYLCPLGAALAIPARLRMFEWLKRRWQCGMQCQICARRCPVQAIHPDGRINPNECIYCLSCQMLYYDDTTCPPLVERRERRDSKLTRRLVERFEAADAQREAGAESGRSGETTP